MERKKTNGIFKILLSIIIIWSIALVFIFINKSQNPTNTISIPKSEKKTPRLPEDKKAIVIKAGERIMTIYDVKSKSAKTTAYGKEWNIDFKLGQEILISYEWDQDWLNAANIHQPKVKSIKITKEKSNVKIPVHILRENYYSKDNVSVAVEELTNTGIKYSIIDNNDYPYNYGDGLTYKLYKKARKSETEETYNEEAISDIPWRKTIILSKNIDNHVYSRGYDWTKLYGELESGEYRLVIFSKFAIQIEFKIDESGNISHKEPILEW